MKIDKENMINELSKTMLSFADEMEKLPTISLKDFSTKDSLVCMIDMINGFCKFGSLSSPNVKNLIPSIGKFLDKAIEQNIPIISYEDRHNSSDAEEFKNYPSHCVNGSSESELVNELKREQIVRVEKNSTNAFLAKNPLKIYPNVKNFLVIGCVTDICIRDFSITLRTYLNEKDINARVIVFENLVDTFHVDGFHDRDSEHLMALYHLKKSGIELALADM